MQAVYTIPDDRLTRKKDIPSSGMTLDIHINSLDELNNTRKIEELFKDFKKKNSRKIEEWLLYLLNFMESFQISKPVYVKKNESGEEAVVYNSSLMELNKLYEIEWGAEKWALKKTDKEIEFQKWVPDINNEEK